MAPACLPSNCSLAVSNFDLNDFHQDQGLGAVAALLEVAKEIPQRFQLLTPADLAKRPPARWRARGVLPMEGIAAIFGPSGSGKSFLVLDLLAAVASGADWFGSRTKAAPVLYIALEGEAGIAQRVHAYQVKHGRLSADFRFLLQSLDIRNATDCADLVSAVQAAGWSGGVLCLDTLNRAAPGMDENDSKSSKSMSITTRPNCETRQVQRKPDEPLPGDREAAAQAWLALTDEADETIIGDVLAQCRHDADARQYFPGRASECATDDIDERRYCDQCGNLRSGVCVVAKPGGVVSANSGYRSATSVPQRCLAFVPAHQPANSL